MKLIRSIFGIMFLAAILSLGAVAQDDDATDETRLRDAGARREQRPNLLRELGLAPAQRQQIRRINMERRPLMEAAMRRLRDANRSLDEAIYANNVNDADVASRLKDVQAAQADLLRIRFTNELAIRKVLSPEQLVRFRDLRRQFMESRRNFRNDRRIRRGGFPRRPNE